MGKKPIYSIVIALSMTSTMVVALFMGGVAATIAQNDGPKVSVTPSQAVANQRISLFATGFTADAEIGEVAEGDTQVSAISIGGQAIPWARISGGNTVSINSDGEWSTTVDLPLTATTTAAGSKTIQAKDSEGVTGSVTVTIPARTVSITPSSGQLGTLAAVRGENFPGKNDNGSSFSVEIEYDTGADVLTTLAVVPDATGDFETLMRIPTTATALTINQVKVSFQDDDGVSVENKINHAVLPGSISLSQSSGLPGTVVTVNAVGFKAFVPVAYINVGAIDVNPVPKPSTNSNGMTSFAILIPGLDPGSLTVEAQVGYLTASTSFTVLAEPTPTPRPTSASPPTPTPTPTLTPTLTPTPSPTPTIMPTVRLGNFRASKTSGPPGTIVKIDGEGFEPSVPIQTVTVGGIGVSPHPQPFTDGRGRLSFEVVIPTLNVGRHFFNVMVSDTLMGLDFTVTAPPTPTPSPTATPAATPAPQLSAGSIPPHVFIGTARLDGNAVSEGTPINAYAGTKLVGATRATPGGKFSIHTLQSTSTITFTVADSDARENWTQWETGMITPGFNLNASSVNPVEETPASVFRANPVLVSAFSYDNANKEWQFYDPRVDDASTLKRFITGQTYLFRVSRSVWLLLNGTEHHLTCIRGNCWNQIVW